MVVVVGEGMPMVVSRERWVQLMVVASAMWVEVVWEVVVAAWCERRATENACRGRGYGAARQQKAAEKCRVVLSCCC